MSVISIILCGRSGKMAQAIAEEIENYPRFSLVAQTSRDISLAETLKKLDYSNPTVIIDFTAPEASMLNLATAAQHKIPILLGTTGFSAQQLEKMDEYTRHIPLLLAPNTSISANLLEHFASFAAQQMPDADIEIAEFHHRAKKDAPSGTALSLAKQLAEVRDYDISTALVTSRQGRGSRQHNEIGIMSMRGGNNTGKQTVYFLCDNEYLELSQGVMDRKVYAQGALKGAHFIVDKSPGMYTMNNVLGLSPLKI